MIKKYVRSGRQAKRKNLFTFSRQIHKALLVAIISCLFFFPKLSFASTREKFENVIGKDKTITSPMYIPTNEERFIKGGKLTISGATLQMGDNSKLIFEPGHSIVLEDGAQILRGENAQIMKREVVCECSAISPCCSNGCTYDKVLTPCGTCKMCNISGKCSLRQPIGTDCGQCKKCDGKGKCESYYPEGSEDTTEPGICIGDYKCHEKGECIEHGKPIWYNVGCSYSYSCDYFCESKGMICGGGNPAIEAEYAECYCTHQRSSFRPELSGKDCAKNCGFMGQTCAGWGYRCRCYYPPLK